MTFEIRYRFSITAAFLFKSSSSYIIMVPILENIINVPSVHYDPSTRQ
jgi:hypothetical protein